MRILFAVGRELSYSRNDVLLRAFRRFAQVDTIGVDQRPRSLLRNSLAMGVQASRAALRGRYDLIFVGFYGHLMLLPLGLLRCAPLLFDAFVSTYDTLVEDRKVGSAASWVGRLAYGIDWISGRLADHILLDTPQHIAYYARTFHLPVEKFSPLPVGCNEDIFSWRERPIAGETTQVLYYTSYLPLHGVETVVRAAALVRASVGGAVRFRVIGEGQTYAQVHRLAEQLGLENIEFIPCVPLEALPGEIARADIGLGGHFGSNAKAGRVVPGKIYQLLAMGCPVVAAETPANQALLQHGVSAYFCPPDDPQGLAQALLALHQDRALRQALSMGGAQLYRQACSEAVITGCLRQQMDRLLER